MKNYILIILFLFISVINSQTLKNRFVHFTEQEGLPANNCRSIIQDHLGYIWIGTGNGISKYDGYEFENFSVAPNDTNFLQLPLTISLYEDSEGNIWIGSVSGITKYDRNKKTFKLFSTANFEEKYDRTFLITDIKETTNKNILFTVVDFHFLSIRNGLYLINTKTNQVSEVKVSNDDSTKALSQISQLGNDKFLISGMKGIAEYDLNKNSIRWYPFNKQSVVFSLLQDDNNHVWLGTYNEGLLNYNLKDSTYTSYSAFKNLLAGKNSFDINKIIYDQNKNLLLATNKGLIHFNVKTNEIAISEIDSKNPFAMHSPYLNDLILDNSGSIWIASEDAGVSKYDIVKNNFRAFTPKVNDPNSITSGWVSSLFEYDNNEVWFSSLAGTIVRFDRQKETFKREPLPQNFEVFNMMRTSNGEILFSGSNGLYKLDPYKWEFKILNLLVDLNNNVVFTALEVENKYLWLGTTAGVFIYDEINGVTTNIDFKTLGIGSTGSNSVHLLIKDKQNNIWIGTDNGLFKYDANQKLYSRVGFSKDPAKSLITQDVNSLYVDVDDNLWVGTWLGGLSKYDQKTGKINSYTLKDGLKSHSVQGIIGDEEDGALWLSTFNGISRFDLNKKTFTNFGVDDGIHGNQFADGSALKASNGDFIFGGLNGFTIFNPKEIKKNLIPPKVFITDFKLFNKSVIPKNNSPLEKPIYETQKLTLNHDENDIEFEYLAAHYVDPRKNQYAYKLENYEDDWRYVENQRTAIYPNLPPGHYVFHLKASNNNEVWNEKGVSVDITILPPWWKTWWAYSVYLFAFGGILGGVRKTELNRRKEKENQKILKYENERKTKELEEARQLQLSMLPKKLPMLSNLNIAVYMQTATEVGGDYYDFIVDLDGTLTVAIGDATGHGMKAGTIVSMVKALFAAGGSRLNMKSYFDQSSEALKGIELGRLMMAFMMLKIKSNKIELANAGMPPLLIYRKQTQEIEEIIIHGMPLGAIKDFPYKIRETEISLGDTILLLSDGLPELKNENGEQYGYVRVKEEFKLSAEKEPEDIIAHLKENGKRWTNNNEPDDDITFVVIKIK